MPLTSKLDRKLRAAGESSDDDEYYEVTDRSSSPSLIDTGAGGEILDLDDGTDDEFDEDASMREDDVRYFASSLPCRIHLLTQV